MRVASAVALLVILGIQLGCGAKDPLDELRTANPGGSEYLAWKNYGLVRFPVDEAESDVEPAVLLKREAGDWSELARSGKGFRSGYEVITYIPELDEDGVAAFGLD